MQEDKIKEAFQKIKEDIDFLFKEIQGIKSKLDKNQISLNLIKRTLQSKIQNQTQQTKRQTDRQTNQTHNENPTLRHPIEAQKTTNIAISTGNEGVPTDRQTDRQTNRHPSISTVEQKIDHLQKVSEIIGSLDSLKKELRFKFKKLTKQEMLIFTTIYQFEEQNMQPDYSLISEKLKLSKSSIRDYVHKITQKGIPLDKIKEENNKVILSIPQDLKKVASLNTIIQLRLL